MTMVGSARPRLECNASHGREGGELNMLDICQRSDGSSAVPCSAVKSCVVLCCVSSSA